MENKEVTYTLTCEKCGEAFTSSVASPVPQLCLICSTWICSTPDKDFDDFDDAMEKQHKTWRAEQEYLASESAKAGVNPKGEPPLDKATLRGKIAKLVQSQIDDNCSDPESHPCPEYAGKIDNDCTYCITDQILFLFNQWLEEHKSFECLIVNGKEVFLPLRLEFEERVDG